MEENVKYLKPLDAAKYLGVTHYALAQWRRKLIGPNFIRINGTGKGRGTTGMILYDKKDLDEYLKRKTVKTRKEYE